MTTGELIGIGVGVAGLAVGGFVLLRSRQMPPPPPPATSGGNVSLPPGWSAGGGTTQAQPPTVYYGGAPNQTAADVQYWTNFGLNTAGQLAGIFSNIFGGG